MSRNKHFANEPKFFRACFELVAASLARNTWKRYSSALRLWIRFRKETEKPFVFLDFETWSSRFLVWGWRRKNLKVNTLKIYLSELKNLGNLAKGFESGGRDLEKILVRGMTNLTQNKKNQHLPVRSLTIADLREIRKSLSSFTRKLTGQSIWTCCLVAFWGAFRLGELLGNHEICYDKFSSLLWEDVTLGKDSVKIRIKSAKVRGPPGNLSVLFPVPDRDLCPVSALVRLKNSENNLGMGEEKSPVFRENGGRLLTKKTFLTAVNAANNTGKDYFTGKSFRAGIPSALESFPSLFRESHLKALGRWRGRSYQTYMKNDEPEFRWVFQFVSTILLKENSVQADWKDDQTTWTESWNTRKTSLPRRKTRVPTRKWKQTRKKTTGEQESN
jgi:hypothetical protein